MTPCHLGSGFRVIPSSHALFHPIATSGAQTPLEIVVPGRSCLLGFYAQSLETQTSLDFDPHSCREASQELPLQATTPSPISPGRGDMRIGPDLFNKT